MHFHSQGYGESWKFWLVSSNGQELMEGKTYTRKRDALRAISRIKAGIGECEVREV